MNAILLALAVSAFAPKTVMTTPAGHKLECGAPRPVATDSTQTVRVCEPKRTARPSK